MSGILDLASHLRRGGAVILSLLDHSNSGEPVSEALKAAAYEAAQDLLALSQNLARSESAKREATTDPKASTEVCFPVGPKWYRGTEPPRFATLAATGSTRRPATRQRASGIQCHTAAGADQRLGWAQRRPNPLLLCLRFFMFSGRKVAQMAAYFTTREGGRIDILKLIKLLYLADREAMSSYGFPISFDSAVSMDHGPVLSRTYDLINGCVSGPDGEAWESIISDRKDHEVALRRPLAREDYDQLSEADFEILDSIWAKFGHLNKWALVKYTHENCKEWKDPNHSSYPITESEIFRALGRGENEIPDLVDCIKAERELDRIFARL